MTRIIAGAHGGRRISAPPGGQTRPTADRVREALFSALDAMTEVTGARFLDLFAGSGAVGLEAVSRGADHALLVESDARAARTIRENIAALRLTPAVRLATGKVLAVLAESPEDGPYDIVFADPPYALTVDELVQVQRALLDHGWLADDAVVVLERATRATPRGAGPGWVDAIAADRSRRYGETTLWYGRRS